METKLNGEIENLIQATQDGKINWQNMPNNPTMVKWDRTVGNESFQITIQGQNIGNPNPAVVFYFFTIFKTQMFPVIGGVPQNRMPPQPQELLLQINTQQEPAFKGLLEKLYTIAITVSKQSSGALLGKILKDIDKP